jgi:hypothetical protein
LIGIPVAHGTVPFLVVTISVLFTSNARKKSTSATTTTFDLEGISCLGKGLNLKGLVKKIEHDNPNDPNLEMWQSR